jgi:hypothetical protein
MKSEQIRNLNKLKFKQILNLNKSENFTYKKSIKKNKSEKTRTQPEIVKNHLMRGCVALYTVPQRAVYRNW